MFELCQKKFEFFLKNPAIADKKLLISFLLMIFLWLIKSLVLLIILAGLLLILLLFSGITREWLKKILLMTFISTFFLFLTQMITGNLLRGEIVALQMIFIIFWSGLLVTTTREMDFVYAIQKILRYLFVPKEHIEKISLIFFIALRSITIISDQYQQIRLAQKARGLENNFLAIVMPLLIKMFKAANSMTEALLAKGFDKN